MLWVFLSILAGLGDAVTFALIKKLKNLDISVKLLLYTITVLPFLLFGFLFYEFVKVPLYFYFIAIVNVGVWILAMFLLMKSLKEADLSISIPLLSFTPIFLLFVSYILLKELPSFLGLIGILVVVTGSYILNLSSTKHAYFEPFKSILKNKGIYMIIVAFLFSITSSVAKIGINLSNPAYFMFMHYLIASIVMIIFFFKRLKKNKKIIKQNYVYMLILGFAVAISELLAATAFKFSIVPYVISIKRSSIIFSVIIGFLFFKEKNFKQAVIGTITMFIGVILITMS